MKINTKRRGDEHMSTIIKKRKKTKNPGEIGLAIGTGLGAGIGSIFCSTGTGIGVAIGTDVGLLLDKYMAKKK